jgi:hypothetical protein
VRRGRASIAEEGAQMGAGDWKNLEAAVRDSLRIGKQNREKVIDVVTRILWLERHKHQAQISALNETLRAANGEPTLPRRARMTVVENRAEQETHLVSQK